MRRHVTNVLAGLAAVAALAAWVGVRPAQAKEWPGPYDHKAGRYYADEARDYRAMGYDVPLPEGNTRPYSSSAPGRYYGSYYYATPVYGATPYANYSYGSSTPSATDNAARLRVVVPADARVWFDGTPTQMTGTVRRFESPALAPGHQYTYDVKAQWRDRDGKEVSRTRHVDVRANSDVTVDFTRAGE